MKESVLENSKVDFLENRSSDFRKISHERAPHTDLSENITHNPPPKLVAGPGAPKLGVTPKNLALPVSGGQNFRHD